MIPCPNCCSPNECEIGSDSFEGEELDSEKWTETGAPTVADGKLELGGGDGVEFAPEPASESDAVKVSIDPQTESDTSTLTIEAGKTDAANRVFGRISRAGGQVTIAVGQTIGGADSVHDTLVVTDTGADLDEPHSIELCWRPGASVPAVGPLEFYPLLGQVTIASPSPEWIFLERAELEDGLAATYPFAESGTVALSFTGFDTSGVPHGSTIHGIEAGVTCRDGSESASQIKVAAIRLLSHSRGPVGDTHSDGVFTAFNPAWSTHGRGDDSDDWNAGMTTNDFGPDFGFFVVFENHDLNERQLEVDSYGFKFWYTTPANTPGRLTLSWSNAGTAIVECVESFDVRAEEVGKVTGLHAGAGDWKIDSYTLSYMQSVSHPGCPACNCTIEEYPSSCDCCDEEFPPPAHLAIGSIGGLTNDGCGTCTQITGTYILDPSIEAWSGQVTCVWRYYEVIDCGEDIDCPDPLPGHGSVFASPYMPMYVVVWLDKDDEDVCRWKARVDAGSYRVVQDPSNPDQNTYGCVTYAEYESEPLATTENCPTLPVTLTKVLESYNAICDGELPGTLTLDAAV